MSDIVSKPNDSTEESLRKAVKLLNNPAPISLSGGSVYVDGGYLEDVGYVNRVSQNSNSSEAPPNFIKVRGFPAESSNYNGIYRMLVQGSMPTNSSTPTLTYQHIDARINDEFIPTLSLYLEWQNMPGNIGVGEPYIARWRFYDEESQCQLQLGGTWTSEHGVGVARGIFRPVGLGNFTALGNSRNYSQVYIEDTVAPFLVREPVLGSLMDGIPTWEQAGGHSIVSLLKKTCWFLRTFLGNNSADNGINSQYGAEAANNTSIQANVIGFLKRICSLLSADKTIQPRSGTLPITTAQRRGTTSSTANTSSTAPAPNNALNISRKYLLFQNISDTDMYINFGAAATTDDLLVPKNGGGIVFESGFVPTDSVNVICSAASKKYFILSA